MTKRDKTRNSIWCLAPAILGVMLAAPVPQISARPHLSIEPAGAQEWRLGWEATPGHRYELWHSPDLGAWEPVEGSPFRPATAVAEVLLPSTGNRSFYRLVDLGAAPITREVFFSNPGPTGNEIDLTLEDKIIELLEAAEPGSTVRGALYTWSRTRMSNAFIAAHQRGVEIRLIVGSDFQAVDLLIAGLPPGNVLKCPGPLGLAGGCHGDRINHNKFFLFPLLADGSEEVVVQSSANFTNPQIRNNNNMVVIRGDGQLYQAYLKYWQDLSRQFTDLNYYRTVSTDDGTKVYFFPRNEASGTTGAGDPIVELLDGFAVGPGSSIRIAMAFWSNARTEIARRLVSLRAAGCDVAVIVNPSNTGGDIFNILENGGIPVTRFAPVHSKYLLLNDLPNRQRRRLVYTGSHNYTGPALRQNDETLLRIVDEVLYEAFLEDWQRMREHPLAN